MTPRWENWSCRACGEELTRDAREVPERMDRTGENFTYGECTTCGAWSIADVPADLGRHYPSASYTLTAEASRGPTCREHSLDLDPTAPARLVIRLVPDRNARVLDVGCGHGRCLHDLWKRGYRHLRGVDPMLPQHAREAAPFPLRHGTIADCEPGWDVIMYHHVFEHVADPREECREAARRLKPGGRLIVRVPLADSWARRHFDTCWVQWDAPRRLWLPTRDALHRLAADAGLRLGREVDDSVSARVWSSRLYRRGLTPARNVDVFPRRRRLLAAAPLLGASRLWARWLNLIHRVDQAAFVFSKPVPA